MRFYTTTHRHYCGIDLHAKQMYVCILNHGIGDNPSFQIFFQREFLADVPDSYAGTLVSPQLRVAYASIARTRASASATTLCGACSTTLQRRAFVSIVRPW